MPGSEHRVSQQYQPGSDRLVDGVATLGNRRHVAQHMRPAQLALGAVDEAVSRILVGHQHPIKLTAQQPLRCLLTAAKRRHEADRDLAQGQPHPASLTAPLVPGFIGMDDGGRLHLLFDGLVGRGEHGADPALRFTDGASAKAQTEVLLELLLYLADALVELTTLQSDIAQQISPHLAVAHRIGQGCFTGGDAPTAGAPIQLMLCHHIADLGQVKHLMNPVGLVMGHHLLTTAGALPGRIVWYCRQSVVLRMTFTPLPLVARLGTTSLAGSGALARRRGPRAISGGGLGGVIAVLVEAVFKLGDARHQLVNQLVGLLEGQRQAGWWRNGFAHDVMVPSWRDQARGNSGSRDDRLTFSCQCHLGEQLQYTRRKYDRYFSPKRILLFALLLVSLTSLALVIYNYATANTLRTINLGQISLYMTSETEKALNVKIDSLTPLIKPVSRKADEQISILVGKEAISYFSINNSSRKLSENIFLLRSGHPVAEEVQCVITTMNQQGNNVSNNYYNNQETTVRYHRDCQAPDNWVEMTRKSKYIVTMNREIVVATVIATDNQGKTLFNLDSVGDLERDNGDISVEIKNTIVNFIDQQALTNNAMVATLVAALTPPKQKAKFIQLPGGIYLSSYLGGVITWPSHGNTKVIQRNDF